MKTLYLVRHCKSDWSETFQKDFDRPLNEKGKANAPLVCSFMNQITELEKVHVAVSTAKRTRETAQPLLQFLSEERRAAVEYNENLYESGLNAYLGVIRAFTDSASEAIVIGHNPSIQHVAEHLVVGHRLAELADVGTGTILSIQLRVRSWSQVNADCGILKWMTTPKVLKKAKSL
ncbi:MAG: histidine phosphatase family protein [Balneolales bacterium]|nr:histidine phosphatase family protein [Balneolales bacterium]